MPDKVLGTENAFSHWWAHILNVYLFMLVYYVHEYAHSFETSWIPFKDME